MQKDIRFWLKVLISPFEICIDLINSVLSIILNTFNMTLMKLIDWDNINFKKCFYDIVDLQTQELRNYINELIDMFKRNNAK